VADRSPMTTTILLLVSDPLVRAVFKETLEGKGYTVLDVGGLGHAVERLRNCLPDLLITRTYIESLTGHDAAVYLRNKCPKMRVLIVGGLLDDDRLRNRELLQGFEVFPKPYTPAELLKKVQDVLSK
jgi:two-component system cell cycle sensor histidine kinase/response regulator CckA